MVASSGLDDALGADTDAPCRDDQLAVLVAVLGDALAEDELAGALALLLPRLAGLEGAGQHVAGADVAVVREVLLGVQPAAASSTAPAAAGALLRLDAGGLLARPEPRLADLRAQEVVGVELGARLGERGRGHDVGGVGLRRVVDRVRISDGPGEHQDVARLYGKAVDGHGGVLAAARRSACNGRQASPSVLSRSVVYGRPSSGWATLRTGTPHTVSPAREPR